MDNFKVMQINNLNITGLAELVDESNCEGFRFLNRLIHDYMNGTNTFNKFGEALYGVFNKKNKIVAIGGLNIDPFSAEELIGRLRRFYVCKEYRRNGIGSMLLTKIIIEANHYFKVLVLHTDTIQGDRFYTAHGFIKDNYYPNSTHYKVFERKIY
ncbi:GNAT family N-acetyltransferase [Cytobacillus massiliigabonensis]|uniref:GNAT family N-acetyltransferase n=1 Tax=Cytobacillus massiliigabonensis TaxID=1871011 RepID=UPI000C843A9B|nr:GNAT family N-acetyltransferase [Cytobacillus massiliigabonensis]